ncbi:hypothetical protein [Agromyces bauzanensis]|uniref:Uncharacterized protein n=1 Tax=Agromyces bauzanensis TaxID=1308924 RepID=A0A917PUF0_9MICO|nr:hypothetical protein [Agromyces bauzanensis]GGJ92136.1 hypothetical protein GCM10011372_33280 [Agromyces bauzanensis]
MSTDDEPAAVDAFDMTDAAVASAGRDQRDAAPDGTVAELRDIETRPLAERAQGYQELADRLRAELEHSDPSGGVS